MNPYTPRHYPFTDMNGMELETMWSEISDAVGGLAIPNIVEAMLDDDGDDRIVISCIDGKAVLYSAPMAFRPICSHRVLSAVDHELVDIVNTAVLRQEVDLELRKRIFRIYARKVNYRHVLASLSKEVSI